MLTLSVHGTTHVSFKWSREVIEAVCLIVNLIASGAPNLICGCPRGAPRVPRKKHRYFIMVRKKTKSPGFPELFDGGNDWD